MKSVRIGTRGSQLALWQAHYVKKLLQNQGFAADIHIIKTKGDQIKHLSFDKIEGKGFFTKELEEALLSHQIDLAVHSMKDLPTKSPEGLQVSGVSARENPADWLIIANSGFDEAQTLKLKKSAVVGTSSARRKCQLRSIRSDIQTNDMRGNVPTRIEKLKNGKADAIVLAAAGISRLALSLDGFHVVKLHPREFVPAPAQGVLAFQTRIDDATAIDLLKPINHAQVAQCVEIERDILRLLDGGCHLPLGAYCEIDNMDNYHVWASYAPSVNDQPRFINLSYSTNSGLAEAIVEQLTIKS